MWENQRSIGRTINAEIAENVLKLFSLSWQKVLRHWIFQKYSIMLAELHTDNGHNYYAEIKVPTCAEHANTHTHAHWVRQKAFGVFREFWLKRCHLWYATKRNVTVVSEYMRKLLRRWYTCRTKNEPQQIADFQ